MKVTAWIPDAGKAGNSIMSPLFRPLVIPYPFQSLYLVNIPHPSHVPCNGIYLIQYSILSGKTLKLGDHAITVTDVKRLDQNRSVYRLEIEPVNGLPSTVVLKQQKEGWPSAFEKEEQAYRRLKDLQGDMIPQFFGSGYFSGFRSLVFSEVVGITLLALAHSERPVDEEKMKNQLTELFRSLSARGAIYWDSRLDNFMYCDKGVSGTSKVMVVDLEQVEFPTSFRPWQLGVNKEDARALMEDFRDIQHQHLSILRNAAAGQYGVIAAIAYNIEQVLGLVRAAETARSPLIIQFFPWAIQATEELLVHARHKVTEAEPGRIEGGEDGVMDTAGLEACMTTAEEVDEFIDTGVDVLAPAFGNVHGEYGPQGPQLDLNRANVGKIPHTQLIEEGIQKVADLTIKWMEISGTAGKV
ncbi:fructose-bisphosphate aldolase [Penicillium sp. IBT 16267x]|nr:fructose-bisphosphate aldolase [Penicillium sp. IBT 16267x]